MATAAIDGLPHDRLGSRSPRSLFDCRSGALGPGPAPSYRLAASAGMRRAIPLCLSGQKGTEVLQALFLMDRDRSLLSPVAVVSAVQTIRHPDRRQPGTPFALGDAASAIAVMERPVRGVRGFDVLGIGLAQGEEDRGQTLLAAISQAVDAASMPLDGIFWTIAHCCSPAFRNSLDEILPGVETVGREKHQEVDFGCADTLVSLAMVAESGEHPLLGTGLLLFAGRHGSTGALLVDGIDPNENPPAYHGS
jgi:hypothetical protein